MRAAIGIKPHSGWAALVLLAAPGGKLQVLERCRIETAGAQGGKWARHPYHAAQELAQADAPGHVEQERNAAHANSLGAIRLVVDRAREAEHEIAACGLLTGDAMPAWSLQEILAVHIRMHKAEGALYREALELAARACGLRVVPVPEKRLASAASDMLDRTPADVASAIDALGKKAGPPWAKDQKESALAAWIALRAP